jgi:regulator of sirC expression with transglutaminase-like and TPR domain
MAMRKELLACFAVVCAGVPFASVTAAQNNLFGLGDPYQACVAAIETDPTEAFERALVWRSQGGGMQADHCAALALIALDEPGEAASRLDTLARRSDAGTLLERARLLAEAGNAWLLAAQPANAEVAFSAALKLAPRDAELWTDRARARAAQMNWDDAEADLTNALKLDPAQPEIFVLRATARSAQGNNVGRKFDIDAALALNPDYPEALVERGIIKLEMRDIPGARADFVRVLQLAPESPAADLVRIRIEALEVPEDRR